MLEEKPHANLCDSPWNFNLWPFLVAWAVPRRGLSPSLLGSVYTSVWWLQSYFKAKAVLEPCSSWLDLPKCDLKEWDPSRDSPLQVQGYQPSRHPRLGTITPETTTSRTWPPTLQETPCPGSEAGKLCRSRRQQEKLIVFVDKVGNTLCQRKLDISFKGLWAFRPDHSSGHHPRAISWGSSSYSTACIIHVTCLNNLSNPWNLILIKYLK